MPGRTRDQTDRETAPAGRDLFDDAAARRESSSPAGDETTRSEETGLAREQRDLARSARVVSLAVLGSRLLGLVREQVMAAFFGAGYLTDAFNVGFRIPNLLRDLFAEGVLSVAFVKTFTEYRQHKSPAEAWRLANLVMSALVVLVSLLVLLGILFAPQIVSLMAYGFSPEKTALAVFLTRLMLPFLLLVALASVAMGLLNAQGRFGIPASASTLFNVGAIAGGLTFAYLLSGGTWVNPPDPNEVPGPAAQWAVIGMAAGTLIGGLLQFFIQVPSLWAVGFRFRPAFNFRDPGLRQVLRLMAPAVVGTASVQINVLITTIYASQISAGISWLNFAFRLMQFPIGLFGVALGTATLPAIARFAARDEIENFRSTLAASIGFVFFLTIPSACGLAVLGRPIIALIYERGEFTSFDTEMVALALVAYSVGLTGYAALKILSPAFYVINDARTPMWVSLASIILNVFLSYLLFRLFSNYGSTPESPFGYGHVGLALSTSGVAILNFLSLALIMRRRIKGLGGQRILSSFWRIALASAALAAASYYTHALLARLLTTQTLGSRLCETFLPIAAGAAVFLLASWLLGVRELGQLLSAFRLGAAEKSAG